MRLNTARVAVVLATVLVVCGCGNASVHPGDSTQALPGSVLSQPPRAARGAHAYVIDPSIDALVKVGLVPLRVEGMIRLPVLPDGREAANALAVSPNGRFAYLLTLDNQLLRVDLAKGTIGPPLGLGGIAGL
jgi:hypothetical protein